jgi:hypothetical protein
MGASLPCGGAGTPSSLSFDSSSKTFDFSYTTLSPGGDAYPAGF